MRRQQGFTLVEMMVSLALLAIVTLVMASTFLVGYKAISNESSIIAASTAVSSADIWLVRDLNSANGLVAGTINSGSSLSLSEGSPAVTVQYSVDANRNLIRTAGGVATVAARGITSVVIAVSGCDATVTLQPSATGAASSTLNVSNRPGGCL